MSTQHSDLSRPEPLHRQVARSLRNQIAAGLLRDGQVLPSSRVLAEQWDVSVYTISQAMKVLADEGLITTKDRSSRTVVAPDVTPEPIRLKTARVVLIGGYAGSGKTQLGRTLARQTGWAILDKDTLSRPLAEEMLVTLGQSPHDRESDTYLDRVRPREYETLAAAIQENLECGNSVIATAPYLREFADAAWIGRTTAAHESYGAATDLVWVHCDADTMHRYLRQRGAARDTVKLADWDGYVDDIELDARPKAPHHVIDNSANSRPLQAQARELLEHLMRGSS